MIDTLNSYLVQNKSISIPGVGTIHSERYPAHVAAGSGQLMPPSFGYRFDKFHDTPVKEFFHFVAGQERIPEYEAIKLYNEFAAGFRADIRQKAEATWEHGGVFRQDDSGGIVFQQHKQSFALFAPVEAVAIPVEKTVAEPVISSEEVLDDIPEYRASHEETGGRRKYTWWIYALVIFVLTLAFLWFHFYNSGINLQAFFNRQPAM